MSFLTTLLAGLLMIVLWYELAGQYPALLWSVDWCVDGCVRVCAVNTYMRDRGKTVLAVASLVYSYIARDQASKLRPSPTSSLPSRVTNVLKRLLLNICSS